MKRVDIDVELMRKLVKYHRDTNQAQEDVAKMFCIFAPDMSTEEAARQYLEDVYTDYLYYFQRISSQLLEEFNYEEAEYDIVNCTFTCGRGFLHQVDPNAPANLPMAFHNLCTIIRLLALLMGALRFVVRISENNRVSYVHAVNALNAIWRKHWPHVFIMLRHYQLSGQVSSEFALYDTAASVYTDFKTYPRTESALQGTPLLSELPTAVALCLNDTEVEKGMQFSDLVNRTRKIIDKDCHEGQTENSLQDNSDIADSHDFTQGFLIQEDIKAQLRAASLPDGEQKVMNVIRLEPESEDKEIAKALDCTVGSVKKWKNRARKRLRESAEK